MKNKENRSSRTGLLGLGVGLIGVAAAAGIGLLYSKVAINHQVELREAIEAERNIISLRKAGKASYYVAKEAPGRPLVLIHSVNAAASALEMKPLFDAYRHKRPVYALELPGYGFSDRKDRQYSPQFFAEVIQGFLSEIDQGPSDVVALSLSSEFVARAALYQPESFHSLVFISPSGLSKGGNRGPDRNYRTRGGNPLYGAISFPLWSQALYDSIASKASIKFFLNRSFVGDTPPELVNYGYATAHQPGAKYVPLYFISGRLFTNDAFHRLYVQLNSPTLIIYDRDNYVSFELLSELLETNEKVNAVRITPTLGLPHWEQLDETTRVLDQFWSSLEA